MSLVKVNPQPLPQRKRQGGVSQVGMMEKRPQIPQEPDTSARERITFGQKLLAVDHWQPDTATYLAWPKTHGQANCTTLA